MTLVDKSKCEWHTNIDEIAVARKTECKSTDENNETIALCTIAA